MISSLDFAVLGQAITINQPHRKFGRCWAGFVAHCGDGKHVLVSKNINGKWTRPLKIERALISAVHTRLARA